jgi:site-specific recombinase XerD
MPKDTKTRYQGVYARHRLDCAVERDRSCNCSPSYWGQVWDRANGKPRKTKAQRTIAEARNARADLEATLRAGMLPASSTMRVAKAIEAYLGAIESGTALNKRGRPYKPSAVRDLRGALEGYAQPAFGGHRLADVRRGDVQRLVDSMTPEKSGSRVRTVVNSIRSLYAWAQDRELVDHDPASCVRLPAMNATPRDRVATVAEMQTLLDPLDPADALPYALAVYATARRSGPFRSPSHSRSGCAESSCGVGGPIRRRCSAPAGSPEAGTAACCRSRACRSASVTRGNRRTSTASRRAKVDERITAHECRHTCASWLDAAGIRPVLVSQLMGHAAPARQIGAAQITQERYTHVLPGEMQLAREQFDQFLTDATDARDELLARP